MFQFDRCMSTHNHLYILSGFMQRHPPPPEIANKNIQQRTLADFLTISLHWLWPSGLASFLPSSRQPRRKKKKHFKVTTLNTPLTYPLRSLWFALGGQTCIDMISTKVKAGHGKSTQVHAWPWLNGFASRPTFMRVRLACRVFFQNNLWWREKTGQKQCIPWRTKVHWRCKYIYFIFFRFYILNFSSNDLLQPRPRISRKLSGELYKTLQKYISIKPTHWKATSAAVYYTSAT